MGVKVASPRMLSLPDDSQVRRAVNRIGRLIRISRLRRGDPLPGQEELRASLGFSNNTLTRAMSVLSEKGVVQRKRKAGTVVQVDYTEVSGCWTVGVASFVTRQAAASPFFSELSQRLQAYLLEAGCRCRVYTRLHQAGDLPPSLEDFDDLCQDLSANVLDGALSPVWVRDPSFFATLDMSTPIVYIGQDTRLTSAVGIDERRMVASSVNALWKRGCRRLAVVSNGPPEGGYAAFWDGFVSALQTHGATATPAQCFAEGNGELAGRRVAARLLQMPPGVRPEGLIVLDDWVAVGLSAALREAGSYKPVVVVQVNRQAPLSYETPVIRSEVDIDELAKRAVDLLLVRLGDPSLGKGIEWVAPVLLDEQEKFPSRYAVSSMTWPVRPGNDGGELSLGNAKRGRWPGRTSRLVAEK